VTRLLRASTLLLLLAAVPATAADVVDATLVVKGGKAVANVAIDAGWHIQAHEPRDAFLIPTVLTLEAPPGVTVGAVSYPEPVEEKLAFSEEPLLLYEGKLELTAALTGNLGGGGTLAAKLRFQACNDSTCLPPRTLEITAPLAGDDRDASAAGADVGRWIADWGYVFTFLWVAVLGLALNLTPCVYPMISVTVAYFGGRTGLGGRRAVGHALIYVLGICTAFSALGVTAAMTGSLFGAALQQPAVLGGIALLMVALALSNFGLYQLRVPSVVMQAAGRVGEGPLGAFFMGCTMGVVGAPCIGPVVAALLLYVGAEQSAWLGFALFFTLGLGMGLPYVGLALVADRLRRLPRGGPWLVWMERLFGFMLLGLALHFATPLLPAGAMRIAWGGLLVTAGLVLGLLGESPSRATRWARGVAGVAVAAFGIAGLVAAESGPPIDWRPYSEPAIDAATAAGRPVLIDFQAEWCLPCRKMEQTTFRDPEVVRASRDFVALMADVTAQDAASDELMRRYSVPGVPTYVLLGRDGRERGRFVGYVEADVLLEGMRTASEPAQAAG
jgi:thiol:disulfide interchange protein DsbD